MTTERSLCDGVNVYLTMTTRMRRMLDLLIYLDSCLTLPTHFLVNTIWISRLNRLIFLAQFSGLDLNNQGPNKYVPPHLRRQPAPAERSAPQDDGHRDQYV